MLFNDLSAEEIASVEETGVLQKFEEGAVIIQEGQAGSSFFLIATGHVEVRKNVGEGRYKKIIELGPGDVFGEIGFLGVGCRSASVVAVGDCEALEFRRADFERLIEAQPAIGVKSYRGLARELARRLAQSDDDLKGTIVWALGLMQKLPETEVDLTSRPKLRLRMP